MPQCISISGSPNTPNVSVIWCAHPDSVIVTGKTCAGENVFLLAEPQHSYQCRTLGGIVVPSNSLPQGQAVVWKETPRKGAKKQMRSELVRFIDRVIAPILVARYINGNKSADRVEAAQ
jgi:hypothetical protein